MEFELVLFILCGGIGGVFAAQFIKDKKTGIIKDIGLSVLGCVLGFVFFENQTFDPLNDIIIGLFTLGFTVFFIILVFVILLGAIIVGFNSKNPK